MLSGDRQALWAMISVLDDTVGAITAALQENPDVWSNTLIIFCSDNGAPPNFGHDTAGNDRNLPYRGFKGQVFEGGVKVPAFVHAPFLAPNQDRYGLMHIVDWMPTLAALVGQTDALNGPTLDGHDMRDFLLGKTGSPRESIILRIDQSCKFRVFSQFASAVRYGDHKLLVGCFDGSAFSGKEVLFDLKTDPFETNNISGSEPEIVQKIKALLLTYGDQMVPPYNAHPPFQGPDYFCCDCPTSPGPTEPYHATRGWIDELPAQCGG